MRLFARRSPARSFAAGQRWPNGRRCRWRPSDSSKHLNIRMLSELNYTIGLRRPCLLQDESDSKALRWVVLHKSTSCRYSRSRRSREHLTTVPQHGAIWRTCTRSIDSRSCHSHAAWSDFQWFKLVLTSRRCYARLVIRARAVSFAAFCRLFAPVAARSGPWSWRRFLSPASCEFIELPNRSN